MSGSTSPAQQRVDRAARSLGQLDAMARLAHETNVVVHVVVQRGPGVVERARQVAHEFGLECYADLRGRSIRIRFTP